MKEVVEEGKEVEERRGRRYKEGDRMVEEEDFYRVFWGENIYKRREERRCRNRGGRELEEGVNSRGIITRENKEVAIGFIGTWDRGLGNPSVS